MTQGMDIYKDFNFRLREYILKKHGSVSAFCRAAGIKYPAQMTPYLKGESIPGKKMLEKLANDGADVDWIMHGKRHRTLAGMGTRLMTSGYKVEMEQIMRRMRLLCQQMDEALSASFDAYAVLSGDLVLEEFTSSFEKFLGYAPGALKGTLFTALIHPDERKSVREQMISDNGNGAASDLSCRMQAADGSYVPVDWCFYCNSGMSNDRKEYVVLASKADDAS